MTEALAYLAGVLTPIAYLAWEGRKRRSRVDAWRSIRSGEYRGEVSLEERLMAEGVLPATYTTTREK